MSDGLLQVPVSRMRVSLSRAWHPERASWPRVDHWQRHERVPARRRLFPLRTGSLGGLLEQPQPSLQPLDQRPAVSGWLPPVSTGHLDGPFEHAFGLVIGSPSLIDADQPAVRPVATESLSRVLLVQADSIFNL